MGSPATIRKKLWEFQKANVDHVIPLKQAGKTSHQDICDSLEMFFKEVMLDFHEADTAHKQWKEKVLAQETVLKELDTAPYDLCSHQNEDTVRLSPEQLKAIMAKKEAERAVAGDD